jgi:hypothetical protein
VFVIDTAHRERFAEYDQLLLLRDVQENWQPFILEAKTVIARRVIEAMSPISWGKKILSAQEIYPNKEIGYVLLTTRVDLVDIEGGPSIKEKNAAIQKRFFATGKIFAMAPIDQKSFAEESLKAYQSQK